MNFKLLFCVAVFALMSSRCEAVVGAHCTKGSDCGPYECCLHPGTCQPMGDVAAHCDTHQDYAWHRPEEMVVGFAMCPCRTGYLCGPISTGSRNGICTFGK